MTSIPNKWLIVESGLSSKGPLLLESDSQLLGKSVDCDVQIDNSFVSRKHCQIKILGEDLVVTDLDSKNGTFVNNVRLSANEPHTLKEGDIIDLAIDGVKLKVPVLSKDSEDQTETMTSEVSGVTMYPGSREVIVRGEKLDKPLSPKEFDVLYLLYSRRGEVVSKNDIADCAWPERAESGVGDQEIQQCIRRIRRRIELNHYKPELVKNIKGVGYIFE
tara:strand:+ start:96 stop:749 length:654 start_codon:yes stop_codon:yes gene_type:complete